MHAEAVRGALAARAIERFGIDAGRLHVDLTHAAGRRRLRALGAGRQGLGAGPARRAPGPCAAGHQRLRRLGLRAPDPGNAAEVALIGASLERLRELSGPAGLVVCDAACGHVKTLAQIARSGLRFIVPLRPARASASATSTTSATGRCARSPTSPSASASCRRRGARATAARCATGRSPTPRPASRSRCASPTSTPPKSSARSPPPENARWPRPRTRSPASSAASAVRPMSARRARRRPRAQRSSSSAGTGGG